MRALLIFIFLITPAFGHEWYSDQVNPITNEGCCGGNDCAEVIDADRLEETSNAWILDKMWVFPKKWERPSPDGAFHACIIGGKPRCFFAPSNV